MTKSLTIYEERINDDLYIYLVKIGRSYKVQIMDDVSSETISSHSYESTGSDAFERAVSERSYLRS